MNILWLTWKDAEHPRAGGAEIVNEELAQRLVRDGHEVIFIVGGFQGSAGEEMRDGFKIIRLGNRFTVYWQAYRYYQKHLENWPDLVIDEVNTIPFFSSLYVQCHPEPDEGSRKQKTILFIHQLARQIWFYELPFPFSLIGYLLEPLYLRLLNNQTVITVSQSTKSDLLRYGFKDSNIHIIPEGIGIAALNELPPKTFDFYPVEYGKAVPQSGIQQGKPITLLALGELRAMKRVDHVLKAFETIRKPHLPPLTKGRTEEGSQPSEYCKLIIAGSTDGSYAKKILRMIARSPFTRDITLVGRVSDEQKLSLLRQSHLLCVTSVKEGWGLVVTEAASQGTPAIVYNVDGLRDSVRHRETGFVCEENSPKCLAENIMKLLSNPAEYERLRKKAWEWSRKFTFERSYQVFKEILTIALK